MAPTAKKKVALKNTVPSDIDLVEWYYEQGFSDGLPVVPPTPGKIAAMLKELGDVTESAVCRVPPRWGTLTTEVLAINLVMAGCKPEYARVVRAALVALTDNAFNLNGVQATTHMASPLLVVNGPVRGEIGMNSGYNTFGSGNRANATIGRAVRMVLLNVGGAWPGDLDKSTLGSPAKYAYCIAENEEESPFVPYHVDKGFDSSESTVFAMAAEPPHSITNHVADDPEGVLESVCSAMSTFAHNNAVSGGHCAIVLGPEHAKTISSKGWSRSDTRNFLWMHSGNRFGDIAFNHRYGKIYNRNLPKWYKRGIEDRIPIVSSPDHIHLFVAGGEAGRFSAFIPGWGHMTNPVLRSISGLPAATTATLCDDEACQY